MARFHPSAKVLRIDNGGKEDKAGTDLLVEIRTKRYRVQVKTDDKAAKYGNVFLETISDEYTCTNQGSMSSCNADKLVYIIVGRWEFYICNVAMVKQQMKTTWKMKYRKPVPNRDPFNRERQWLTLGICVPIEEFHRLTEAKKHNFRQAQEIE